MFTREEVLSLIRSAFNEGFSEGMRETTTYGGGKTWAESKTLKKFSTPAPALSSPARGDAT